MTTLGIIGAGSPVHVLLFFGIVPAMFVSLSDFVLSAKRLRFAGLSGIGPLAGFATACVLGAHPNCTSRSRSSAVILTGVSLRSTESSAKRDQWSASSRPRNVALTEQPMQKRARHVLDRALCGEKR